MATTGRVIGIIASPAQPQTVRARDNKRVRPSNASQADTPPHTGKLTGLCPRCNRQSNFEVVGSYDLTFQTQYDGTSFRPKDDKEAVDRVTAIMCRGCGQGMAVIEEKINLVSQLSGGVRKVNDSYWQGVHCWPIPAAQVSEDVPSEIAEVFTEAVTTLHAGAPRAAAVMARATLDAITLQFGEDKNDNLAKRLKNMADKHILQTNLAEWATEVRLIGNAGAHDPVAEVKSADAHQLIDFIRQLMAYLYEMPAELARRRAPKVPDSNP